MHRALVSKDSHVPKTKSCFFIAFVHLIGKGLLKCKIFFFIFLDLIKLETRLNNRKPKGYVFYRECFSVLFVNFMSSGDFFPNSIAW